jgi:hypothetical protein
MKIKGLSIFQQAVLKIYLPYSKKTEIQFNDSISLKRLDSLWYGGNVVDIKYEGYTFHIEALGDVYADLYAKNSDELICCVKDKNNGGLFKQEIASYFRSDKDITDAENEKHLLYDLNIKNNNWWECSLTDPQNNLHDLTWSLGSNNLFEAIDEVLDGMNEAISTAESTK